MSGSRRVARYKEKAMKVRRAVSLEFAEAFKKVDVLLAPTAPTTAPPLFPEAETMDNHGQAYGQIVGSYAADAMTVPASLAGLPAVSLPVGLGLTTGLPVGMQVIAARGNDADALGFAMRLEERINELGDDGGEPGPRRRRIIAIANDAAIRREASSGGASDTERWAFSRRRDSRGG